MTDSDRSSARPMPTAISNPGQRVVAMPGGSILLASLVLTVGISLGADFNSTHLFNPNWPPHAVFHDAAMLHLLTGVGLLAVWMLLRRSLEPDLAASVGFATPVIFWTPFFWLTWVMPNASLNALETPPPSVGGVSILPNVVVAGTLVLMSTWGFSRYRRAKTRT